MALVKELSNEIEKAQQHKVAIAGLFRLASPALSLPSKLFEFGCKLLVLSGLQP